jgi:hypothetical protein
MKVSNNDAAEKKVRNVYLHSLFVVALIYLPHATHSNGCPLLPSTGNGGTLIRFPLESFDTKEMMVSAYVVDWVGIEVPRPESRKSDSEGCDFKTADLTEIASE